MVRDRRGRISWDHAHFVLRGRRARLVRLAGRRTGLLRHAPHGGVARFAFRATRGASADVFLNRRRVRLPRPRRGGTYALVLSANDGLRHGRNLLRLDTYRDDGRYQVIRRRIGMPRMAPLAAAGRDLVGRHRRPVGLDARRSRSGAARARLDYRWRIVEAPPGARTRVRSARRARASFVPDVAGRYVLAVTVSQRTPGRRLSRSTDLVEVTALANYPPLGARLDTRAPDPQKNTPGDGILVGRDWHSYDAAFPAAQAAVYVVDPISLWLTETIKVDPNAPDSILAQEIQKVQPGSILITVGREGCCALSGFLPNMRFSYITAYDGQGLRNFGKTGTWNRNLRLGDGTRSPGQAGELTGYLQLDDSAQHFRFVQPDRIAFSTAADAQPTDEPADGATYRIVSASAGTAVDVAGDGTSAGQSLVAKPPGGASSQQWRLVRAYGGFYKLVNARSGMCIDVPGFSRRPEQPLEQFRCDPSDHNQLNQLWLPIMRPDDGSYVLASANTPRISTASPEMVLTIQGSGPEARLVQAPNSGAATQRWRFSVPPGVYTITSEATAVEVPGYSASWETGLVQRAPASGANQQWRLTDGPDGTFRLQSLVSGLCMNVTGGSRDPGVAIEQYGCDPNRPNQPNQLWRLEPQDDGSFALVSANSTGRKMALSVRGRSTADGAVLVQDTLDAGEPTQQWRLHRYPGPAVGGGYSITSSLTGKAIDVPGGSTSVGQILQQYGFNGTGAQQWWLDDAGDGFVKIRNPSTGLCMSTSERNEGGKIVLVADQDNCTTSRLWRVVPQGDGTFALASAREPSSVLTLDAASPNDGTRFVMAPDTAARHQRWVFGGRTTTFRLGDARYVTALPPAAAGFAVMAVDAAARPVGGTPRAFATNGGSTAGHDANQNDLANNLKTLAGRPGTTVLVQSLGAPKPNRGGWNAIGDAIQLLGGDRPTFLQLDGSGDYALAGCQKCPAGQPTMNEVLRRRVSRDVPKARLDGLLERNGESTFTAAHAGPGQLDSTLADLAYRTTTPWPYTDTANGRRALSDIAVILKLTTICGRDLGGVRPAYCVKNLGDSGSWASKASEVRGIAYSEIDNPPYDKAFFNAVKAQLEAEMGWLNLSHGVISEIRNVFTAVSGNFAPFKADDIAAVIKKDLARPIHDRQAEGRALEVILTMVELGTELAEVPTAALLGFGSTIIGLAGDNDDGSNGASLGALSAAATDYGRQLDNRFKAVVTNLNSIEDLIATDYGKLSMMAANAGEDWAMDNPKAGSMNGQLKAGATQELWRKLLPTAYKLYRFPPPPAGYKLQELFCGKSLRTPGHYVYTGQPDAAIFAPIAGVDGNGSPQRPNVQSMTPIIDDRLANNVYRVVRQPLLDLLYSPPTFTGNAPRAGLAPDEMSSRVPFASVNHSSQSLQNQGCSYRHR